MTNPLTDEAHMQKSLILLSLMTMALAGCQTEGQNAAAGAVGGAAVGAALAGDNELQGALVGAAVGVAASTLVRPTGKAGQCLYRDQYGREFTAACR
jgi:hypothetical protein